MAIYRRGPIWWADVTINGQRTRRSLETDSVQEARRRERDLIRSETVKPKGKTLEEALSAWLDERQRGRSDLSILGRLAALEPVQASQVNDEWCREHLGALGAANYNRHIGVIHAALALIGEPSKLAKRKTPPGRTRFLSRPEWSRLYAALPGHMKPLCAFALATGLRQENVLRLEWSAVDLPRRLAWVAAESAKGRRPISIPLSDDAVQILTGAIGRHERFVFTWGEKVRRPYLTTPKNAWATAIEAARLEGVTFHTLRHTWASWHIMAGTPLIVLQKLGGWASLEMVQRYAHLAPDHTAQFANRVIVHETKE